MKRILACAALGLSLVAAACADPVAPATPTPIDPTITETFTGTLLSLGSNQHPFTVGQVGGLIVTVSDIAPKVTIGFAVGIPGISGCTIVKDSKAVTGANTLLSGTATIAGNFCIGVFDTGEVVDPVTYTVTVKHS
jgi:hypothetical protein